MNRSKKIVLGFAGSLMILATGFRCRYGSNEPVFDNALYAVDLDAYRPFENAAWGRVLNRCVHPQGGVDFRCLAQDGSDLECFLRQAAAIAPEELARLTPPQRLAFWIDVFHAGVLRAVARHYPIEADPLLSIPFPANSIKQIHRLKFFRREQLLVAGQRLSLQEIEDQKIWGEARDPRALFVLYRTAKSSPALAATPFFGSDVESRLDQAVRAFLATPEGMRWNAERRILALSRLFEWNEDRLLDVLGEGEAIPGFKAQGAAMLRFALRYGPAPVQETIRGGNYTLDALGFDWTLAEASLATN